MELVVDLVVESIVIEDTSNLLHAPAGVDQGP